MRKIMEKCRCVMHARVAGGSNYFSTIVCVFLFFGIFVGIYLVLGQISRQDDVERIYRSYLLRMEREGCLTATDKTELVNELTALGVSNIDLTGTSVSPVGYGNEVRLRITGDLTVDRIRYTADDMRREGSVVHIDIDKTGTALY